MEWSPQQEIALSKVGAWMHPMNTEQVFYLAGFAGTGKSTLAKHLVANAPGMWLFASYTGKAAHVLRQKGCEGASTIHSLIYRPNGESRTRELLLLQTRIYQLEDKDILTPDEEKELNSRRAALLLAQSENKPSFALWPNSPLADAGVDGIVVDEVSMVDERLGRDLESFGKKILVLGDPAQLPPVGAGGYFTKRVPDVQLTEVHRHARESNILRLATDVREGRDISSWATIDPESESDVYVCFKRDFDPQDLKMRVMNADQVLVGRNATRKAANRQHRGLLGRTDPCPVIGDRLVCLRNNRESGLFNGSQWIVKEAENELSSKTTDLEIVSEDEPGMVLRVPAWMHHFVGAESELTEMGHERRDLMEFDFSYALTTHKAQGSQWNDVFVIDESAAFRQDAKRWLYTAVTRAAKRLTVLL